jgi:hypothetical protein
MILWPVARMPKRFVTFLEGFSQLVHRAISVLRHSIRKHMHPLKNLADSRRPTLIGNLGLRHAMTPITEHPNGFIESNAQVVRNWVLSRHKGNIYFSRSPIKCANPPAKFSDQEKDFGDGLLASFYRKILRGISRKRIAISEGRTITACPSRQWARSNANPIQLDSGR